MYSFRSMNTTFHATGITQKQAQQVEAWIRYVESKLSRFIPDSELSQLNQNQGIPFISSELLFTLVSLAEQYYRETEGCFNPFMGHLLSEWGYKDSFEKITYGDRDFAQAYYNVRMKEDHEKPAILNSFQKSIQLAPTASLDLGGIAKGWSVQKMSHWLQAEGVSCGFMDGGGDLFIWGDHFQNQPIGIASPFQPEKDIALLWISRDAAIATSSTMKRQWTDHQGTPIHHLLDPQTRCPSQSDIVQATVIAPDLGLAEVYAKCLVIQGSQGFTWLKNLHPDIAYAVVTDNQETIWSSNIQNYCHYWEVL